MNKLCFSFHFNEVCRCMWQVNIESLWRNELQPRRSAERRRLQPNEEWTLIIRRIRLPRETSTLACMHARTHAHSTLNNLHPFQSRTATNLTRFSFSPGPLQVAHSVLVSSLLGFFCMAVWRCRRSRGSGSYGNRLVRRTHALLWLGHKKWHRKE